MRNGVNRLVAILLLAAIVAGCVLIAIEVIARLAGEGPQLGGLDYRSGWSEMVDWAPGRALQTTIFAAVGLVGLLVLIAEVRPRRRERTVEIGRSAHGPVLLRADSVAPYLRGRMDERDFVRNSAPHVELTGLTAELRDHPRTTRPVDETELAQTREAITRELRRMGLEPATVIIEPREPRPPRERGEPPS
ncbi:MAG: hypothetical protein QOD86_1253 [Miltoncostaeaceae bacterium]|nr:hypothetical protein [Miltoncostaeaceae bacterium]